MGTVAWIALSPEILSICVITAVWAPKVTALLPMSRQSKPDPSICTLVPAVPLGADPTPHLVPVPVPVVVGQLRGLVVLLDQAVQRGQVLDLALTIRALGDMGGDPLTRLLVQLAVDEPFKQLAAVGAGILGHDAGR